MSETDQLDDIHFGNKMVLLMDILKECAMIGDKVSINIYPFLSLEIFESILMSGAGVQSVSALSGPHRGVPGSYK